MPQLIRNIECEVLETIESKVKLMNLFGEIYTSDYVRLNNFTAYLQDLSAAVKVTELPNAAVIGIRKDNDEIIELEISY